MEGEKSSGDRESHRLLPMGCFLKKKEKNHLGRGCHGNSGNGGQGLVVLVTRTRAVREKGYDLKKKKTVHSSHSCTIWFNFALWDYSRLYDTRIFHILHIYIYFFTFLPFPVQERSYHTGFRVREIDAGDAYRCHYLINDEAEVTRFVCL